MIHQTPGDFLDRITYPLDEPESITWTKLVNRCKKSLNAKGACILKNFVHQSIVERMVLETERIKDKSHFCKDNHNVFFEEDDTSLPADHPLRIKEDTSLNSIPYDLMNPTDALHQLYNWHPLIKFLSAVLGHTLYRMADPMAALTLNVMNEHQNHGWHYDESQVTITLLIQKPVFGGVFEYVPNLRKFDTNDYSKLGSILNGSKEGIVPLNVEPGDLLIFAGFYSLHRVTSVVGKTTRYVGTLCYKDKPNVLNSPEVQQLFYGRVNQG